MSTDPSDKKQETPSGTQPPENISSHDKAFVFSHNEVQDLGVTNNDEGADGLDDGDPSLYNDDLRDK